MEPTEAQYLILNALETLELLQFRLYDDAHRKQSVKGLDNPYSSIVRSLRVDRM